ncbi:MAG TPA: hypothetical protein VLC06_04385 [Polyangia bacterium]|nr:hypothetical protein [Polyangia bacterium]
MTSVSGSQPLATATAAQLAQLCADTIAYSMQIVSAADSCKLTGLNTAIAAGGTGSATDAQLQEDCSDASGHCLAPGDAGAESCDLGDLSSCAPTATISEYTACITEEGATIKQAVGSFPACNAVTASSLSSVSSTLAAARAGPSCQKLAAACPGMFAS